MLNRKMEKNYELEFEIPIPFPVWTSTPGLWPRNKDYFRRTRNVAKIKACESQGMSRTSGTPQKRRVKRKADIWVISTPLKD
jgi:hypothetical protein